MTLPRESTEEQSVDETEKERLQELILTWLGKPPDAPKEQEPPKTPRRKAP